MNTFSVNCWIAIFLLSIWGKFFTQDTKDTNCLFLTTNHTWMIWKNATFMAKQMKNNPYVCRTTTMLPKTWLTIIFSVWRKYEDHFGLQYWAYVGYVRYVNASYPLWLKILKGKKENKDSNESTYIQELLQVWYFNSKTNKKSILKISNNPKPPSLISQIFGAKICKTCKK